MHLLTIDGTLVGTYKSSALERSMNAYCVHYTASARKIKKPPSGGFLLPGGSEQGGALRVRFEGLGLPAQPAPNPPFAAAERQPRAPQARVRGSNQLFD